MYYVMEISTGDPKIAGRAVYAYESLRDASATFHSKLGTAMKSDLYETELIIVVDEYGSVIKRERYEADRGGASE